MKFLITPSIVNPTKIQLLTLLGHGTYAKQVALAKDQLTNQYYAIKTLEKSKIIKKNQVHHVLDERRVLMEMVNHPYISELVCTIETPLELHLLLKYYNGGELFFYLLNYERFNESMASFYAAEVLYTLQSLHAKRIIYRDLKPENILLDSNGHIRLIDFGFAKYLDEEMNDRNSARTYSFCGTPEYLSPEIIQRSGHSFATDIWTFGCFLYELLTGISPFQHESLNELYKAIQCDEVSYPTYLSSNAIDLLTHLLDKNETKRYTIEEIMRHPFFQSINWEQVKEKTLSPPILPNVTNEENDEGGEDEEEKSMDHQIFINQDYYRISPLKNRLAEWWKEKEGETQGVERYQETEKEMYITYEMTKEKEEMEQYIRRKNEENIFQGF